MNLKILKIASYTNDNRVLENPSHILKNKNPICGDEIEIRVIIKNDIVKDIAYQCKSCVYCQASVSLLSRKIKNQKIYKIKKFILLSENIFENTKTSLESHWKDFKELFDKKNIPRKECILLPFKTLKRIVSS